AVGRRGTVRRPCHNARCTEYLARRAPWRTKNRLTHQTPPAGLRTAHSGSVGGGSGPVGGGDSSALGRSSRCSPHALPATRRPPPTTAAPPRPISIRSRRLRVRGALALSSRSPSSRAGRFFLGGAAGSGFLFFTAAAA